METVNQLSCDQVVLRGSATQQVVTAVAREVELPPDAQTWESGELELAPKANSVAKATATQTTQG